jgi:hypothetical protein
MARSKKCKYTTIEKRPSSGHSVDPLSAWCIPRDETPENGFLRFIRTDKVVPGDAVDPLTTDTNDDIASNDEDSTMTEDTPSLKEKCIVIKEGKFIPYLFCGKCVKWQLPSERPHTIKYHAKFKASLTAQLGKKHPYHHHLKTYQASNKGTKPKRNTKIIKAETAAKKLKGIGGGVISRPKKNVPAASKKTTSKRGKGKPKNDVDFTETVTVMQEHQRRSNRPSITTNHLMNEMQEEKKTARSGKKRGSNKTDQQVSNPKRIRTPLSPVNNRCVPKAKSSSSDDDLSETSSEWEGDE